MTDSVDVGRSPDVLNAPQNGVILNRLVDDTSCAFHFVVAVVINPGISQHLLAEPELQDVAGKQVRIVRGSQGRELLAEKLTARGAEVNYLSVYERRLPEPGPDMLAEIEIRWRRGDINVVTAMSVQSLVNLLALLPAWCLEQMEATPLVTPAGRVLKEVLDRYPASRPVLAAGPQADDMVRAIIALHTTDPGIAP